MNALFLLCQCNSCVTKACGALVPVVQQTNETGANFSDVCIADVICRTIVIIVTILVAGFLAWKLIDNNAKENEREFNKKKEEEESKRKLEADQKKRDWQHEDEDRKQKADELKRRWQQEDEDRKQEADQIKRDWQHEDEDRKQKAEELSRRWKHEDEERKQKAEERKGIDKSGNNKETVSQDGQKDS